MEGISGKLKCEIYWKIVKKPKDLIELHRSCLAVLQLFKNMVMKKMKLRKKRNTEFKENIMRNNLMQRFIREIEREDALDKRILQTMLAYQPVSVR